MRTQPSLTAGREGEVRSGGRQCGEDREESLWVAGRGVDPGSRAEPGWAPTSGKLQLKQEAQPHLEQVVPQPRPWRHRMRSQPWGLVHQVRLAQLST